MAALYLVIVVCWGFVSFRLYLVVVVLLEKGLGRKMFSTNVISPKHGYCAFSLSIVSGRITIY